MGAVAGLAGGKQKPGLLMPRRRVVVKYVYLCSWTGRSLCVTGVCVCVCVRIRVPSQLPLWTQPCPVLSLWNPPGSQVPRVSLLALLTV